jgi:hypothetical protein
VTLDIAGFLQTLEGRGHHGREPSGRRGVKKSHHRHRRLLRTRCERQAAPRYVKALKRERANTSKSKKS